MIKLNERDIALAIVAAFEMWTDSKYRPFLQKRPTRQIMDKAWFDKFLGEWRVARTIRRDKREEVREYLNGEFRVQLQNKGAAAVDIAANKFSVNEWSQRNAKTGVWSEPVSLVSKVAFFFQPNKYVPLDTYSRIGVNVLREKKNEGGLGNHKFPSYESYLSEFEIWFKQYKGVINEAHECSWVQDLADKLGCQKDLANREAFKRKVFDNILMRQGGR